MEAIEARKLADLMNDASRTEFQEVLTRVLQLIRQRAEIGKYSLNLVAHLGPLRAEILMALRQLGYQVEEHVPTAFDEIKWGAR